MFEYFKSNYAWNLTALTLIDEVGTISQPAEAFAEAAKFEDQPMEIANNAWYEAMAALGDKTERCARNDLAAGHRFTAARKFHRAAMYFLRADRVISNTDPRRLPIYQRALENYRAARDNDGDHVEFVEIPYEGGVLPALLITATTDGTPAPIVIHLQGFDVVKEMYWPLLGEYRRRGLSVLIVDQPGAGGALRLHKLHARYDAEAYVRVIVDWIMGRPDLATDRIGLCGISMGGYLAPRAAAFEPRIKACAAWGALYDAGGEVAKPILEDNPDYIIDVDGEKHNTPPVPDMIGHAKWIFGVDTPAQLGEISKKMTLKNVVDKITGALLVMHGENDRQAPLSHAVRTYEEATTANKKLKVFGKDEGGVEHCQIDNSGLAADYLSDWFAENL